MSGGNLNYQLRPNKYVERALFVELLSKICGAKTHTYAYVSMGGPQLEDHRLIHKTLGIKKLYSFEIDKNVLLRQQFNKSPSVLTCLSGSISHFIDDFEGFTEREKLKKYKLIIWLDYASGEG